MAFEKVRCIITTELDGLFVDHQDEKEFMGRNFQYKDGETRILRTRCAKRSFRRPLNVLIYEKPLHAENKTNSFQNLHNEQQEPEDYRFESRQGCYPFSILSIGVLFKVTVQFERCFQ